MDTGAVVNRFRGGRLLRANSTCNVEGWYGSFSGAESARGSGPQHFRNISDGGVKNYVLVGHFRAPRVC